MKGFEVRVGPGVLDPLGSSLTQRRRGHTLGQDVERVVYRLFVAGELEGLERLQLVDKRRDGAEAAALEVGDTQRRPPPERCRERRLVFGRVPDFPSALSTPLLLLIELNLLPLSLSLVSHPPLTLSLLITQT